MHSSLTTISSRNWLEVLATYPNLLITSISEESKQRLDDIEAEIGGDDSGYLLDIAIYVCNTDKYGQGANELVIGIVDEFHSSITEDYMVMFGLDEASLAGSDIGSMIRKSIQSVMNVFCSIAIELFNNLVKVGAPTLELSGECVYEPLQCDGRNVVLVMKIPPLAHIGKKEDIDALSILRGRELY